MNEMLYHAVLVEGTGETGLAAAHAYCVDVLEIPVSGNPDYTLHASEQFTIDDARSLKRRAIQTPLGKRQVFILAFERITHAAQNALLKLLEEPATNTHFVLVVPSFHLLLPTVRSRLQELSTAAADVDAAEGEVFIRMTPLERLSFIAPLIKNADRSGGRALCDTLERYLYAKGTAASEASLREVLFVRKYISDASSSVKMLLEHLAVVL